MRTNGTVSVCPSDCLSVRPSLCSYSGPLQQTRWCSFAAAEDINRLLHGRRAADQCGQCHVVSVRSSWTRTCKINDRSRLVYTEAYCLADSLKAGGISQGVSRAYESTRNLSLSPSNRLDPLPSVVFDRYRQLSREFFWFIWSSGSFHMELRRAVTSATEWSVIAKFAAFWQR